MKKDIIRLVGGNGFAQALQMIALIFLARLYSVEDFGLLGKVQAFATIAVVLMTLQLHLVIPTAKDDKEAHDNLFFSLLLSSIIFLIFLFPAFLTENCLALLLAVILGLSNAYKSFFVYRGDFKSLSSFYVIRVVNIIIGQIIMWILNVPDGLIYGAIIGESISIIYLYIKGKIDLKIPREPFVSLVSHIKKQRQFTLYGTFQEFVSVANFYLPLYLFVEIYGKNTGGQYMMASRLVWAPVILLTSSLSQVYYHQMTQNGDLSIVSRWIWLKRRYMLALIAIPVLYYYFSDVTILLLGEKWDLAKEMIFYLLWMGLIFIYSLPYRVSFRVLKRMDILLIIESIVMLCSLMVFWVLNVDALFLMRCLIVISLIQMVAVIFFSIHINKKRSRHI